MVTAFLAVKSGITNVVLRDGLGERLLVQPLIPKKKNAISGTISLCLGGMMDTRSGTQATPFQGDT